MKYRSRDKKEMKSSVVEWIGEIPQDWGIQPLKHFANFQSGDGFPEILQGRNTGDRPFMKVSDINGNGRYVGGAKNHVSLSDARTNRWHEIPKGAVLMAKIGAALLKNHRKITLNKCFIDNNMLAVVPKSNIKPVFLFWIMKTIDAADIQNISTVPSINMNLMRNRLITIPNEKEQKRIADFLDEKTAIIDEIVKKKNKQIDLLKEKRAALITQAVTKGLDLDVEMKDSGVEWIGEIPEGWEVNKLKQLSNHPFQYGMNESASENNNGDVRYIRITDIKNNSSLKQNTVKTMPAIKAKGYLLNDGDLLFARSGATAGKTFMYRLSHGPSCFAGYLIRFVPDKNKLLSSFIDFVTQSTYYANWKNSISIQATIQNISAEKYKELLVVTPPIHDQTSIINFLNKKTEEIDLSIKKIQKSIKLTQEYRSSLISHAVTGKIVV